MQADHRLGTEPLGGGDIKLDRRKISNAEELLVGNPDFRHQGIPIMGVRTLRMPGNSHSLESESHQLLALEIQGERPRQLLLKPGSPPIEIEVGAVKLGRGVGIDIQPPPRWRLRMRAPLKTRASCSGETPTGSPSEVGSQSE